MMEIPCSDCVMELKSMGSLSGRRQGETRKERREGLPHGVLQETLLGVQCYRLNGAGVYCSKWGVMRGYSIWLSGPDDPEIRTVA